MRHLNRKQQHFYQNDREALRFLDLINAFNLQQHVQEATHRLGHTLDLVITRAAGDFVKDLFTTKYLPSGSSRIPEHTKTMRQ